MKVKYFLTPLMLFTAVLFAQQALAAEDLGQAVDLQALTKQCEGCHGANGNSTREDVPRLAGKPVAKIEEAISQFYYYERHCPTKTPEYGDHKADPNDMCSIANSLSKVEIQALAQYFSKQ